MEYAYASDTGLFRETNEDSVGVFCIDNVFTVALLLDGMGGVNGGKIASSTAYETMATELELRLSFLLCENKSVSSKEIGRILTESAAAANRVVYNLSRQDVSLRGMGTTLVAAVIYENHCCVLNVGDSRGYYLADGQITQITKDQSYLQYLLDTEKIEQSEAVNFAEKNVIMSAVGTEKQLKSDLYYLTFSELGEEFLLLTSDGLHDYLSEQVISRTVFADSALRDKVINLIDGANAAGGEDNISAVLVRK